VVLLVLHYHHLRQQIMVVINKATLVFQVLNPLKVLVSLLVVVVVVVVVLNQHKVLVLVVNSYQHMNQIPFHLKVVLGLHSVEQVLQDTKVIVLQQLVPILMALIRLLLRFLLQILIRMENLMLMNFVNS
jgi:hypothetical protein